MRKFLIAALALFCMGCEGYKVVRVTGWAERSKVAQQTYTLRRIPGNDYWTSVMLSPSSPTSALYIPNYAYYQGFIYTPKAMSMIGQVRLIGGAAAGANVMLRSGAMVTTNPEALLNRVQPSRYRYQVVRWKEI